MHMVVSWAVCCTRGRWFDSQALMLRDSLQRWVASQITGEVTPGAAPWERLFNPEYRLREPDLQARTSDDGKKATRCSRQMIVLVN